MVCVLVSEAWVDNISFNNIHIFDLTTKYIVLQNNHIATKLNSLRRTIGTIAGTINVNYNAGRVYDISHSSIVSHIPASPTTVVRRDVVYALLSYKVTKH